jgi:hypothetical protein
LLSAGEFGLSGVHQLRHAHAVQPDAKIKIRKLLTVFNGWRGIDMAAASIEVSGPNAERLAGELQAALATAIEPGDSVSPVEVERSADLVIAIIGLVFSGVGTAKTIWDWWGGRRSEGVTVKILLDDGIQVDLSGVDQKQLEVVLDRRTLPGIDAKK